MGSVTTNKIDYPSMLAGYGDFGALQRIGFYTSASTFGTYTFTNIPQTFQDLRIVMFARDTNTGGAIAGNYMGFNGDVSATNYSVTTLSGNGSSASSSRNTNAGTFVAGVMPTASATSGVYAGQVIDILNYANTSTFKTMISRSAADVNGSGETRMTVGLWRNTAAVTSIIFGANSGYAGGSSFALYGVKASAA